MVLLKEKLEKKFYRTKSESHRLNELRHMVETIRNGKNHLLAEFKGKHNKYQNHSYDDQAYQNILNTLKANRSDLVLKKETYQNNKDTLKQDISKKQSDITTQASLINLKESKLSEVREQIRHEMYNNDQLESKSVQLIKNIETIRKNILSYIQVEGRQENLLERLKNHQHISEIKKVI